MPFAGALFYEDVGEGLPLLLFHGFPLTSQSFWPQLSGLRGVRLLVPDHRGFGKSPLGSAPITLELLAEDGLRVLDAAGLSTAVVGGVSMGGYVAMALLRLDPSRARGLVLIDTQATADDEAGRARREASAVEVLTQGVGPLTAAMLPRLLAPHADAAVRARVEHMMLGANPEAVAAASRAMAQRSDSRDVLARFVGPTLVVVGEHDAITPLAKARELAELVAGAELVTIAGAAHLPNLEQAAAFNATLEDFLGEGNPRLR
jgi:pimeloyl-ACP methyl ester carboxylesterase